MLRRRHSAPYSSCRAASCKTQFLKNSPRWSSRCSVVALGERSLSTVALAASNRVFVYMGMMIICDNLCVPVVGGGTMVARIRTSLQKASLNASNCCRCSFHWYSSVTSESLWNSSREYGCFGDSTVVELRSLYRTGRMLDMGSGGPT